MARLVAYLHFNGNADEAMNFYAGIFGGTLEIKKVGDSPMAESLPPELHKNIIHSVLRNVNITLMGSDMMDIERVSGNVVSLCLVCESKEEIVNLFKRLSVGGRVTHELKEEFFGVFGDLTDKYGINWMLQFEAKHT